MRITADKIAALKNSAKGVEAKWIAAFVSCLLVMVQGDVTLIDTPHWIKAAKTATSASMIFIILMLLPKVKAFAGGRSGSAVAFGGGVFVSDLWVHPTHFAFPAAEALTTAILSAALAYIAHEYLAKE